MSAPDRADSPRADTPRADTPRADTPRADTPRADSPRAVFVRDDSFHAAVGGHETFVRLVDRFYEGVAADDVLAPMYPESDHAGARQRLTMFLEQYWGGPTTYSEQRGHPRLRMRHAPFTVNREARDRWLAHMRVAVDSLGLAPLHQAQLWDYLERAAHSLLNTFDD